MVVAYYPSAFGGGFVVPQNGLYCERHPFFGGAS